MEHTFVELKRIYKQMTDATQYDPTLSGNLNVLGVRIFNYDVCDLIICNRLSFAAQYRESAALLNLLDM
jgi:hypothetical protein